jgi:hypothetical protein
MNSKQIHQEIEIVKKEHEQMERELLELNFIIEGETINYSNMVHTFVKIKEMWDIHEKRVEKVFNELVKKEIKIPIKQILFEHGKLNQYYTKIKNAINSGSEPKIKKTLNTTGKELIKTLKDHITFEDEIIYTLPK